MERMKSLFRGGPSIPTVFLIFVILMMLTNLTSRGMVEHITYSEFKAMVAQSDFTEVQLSHDMVRGVMPLPPKAGAARGSNATGAAKAPGVPAVSSTGVAGPAVGVSPGVTGSGATSSTVSLPGSATTQSQGASSPATPGARAIAPAPPAARAPSAQPTTTGVSTRADDFIGGCSGAREAGGRVFEAVRVENDSDLIRLLDQKGVQYRALAENNWLQSVVLWMALPMMIFLFGSFLLRRMSGGQGPQVMTFGKNRARVVAEEGTGISFNDVAGIDEAKEELEEIIAFLKTPEKFQRLGGRIPKGVLLVGPPGTGKTLLARAVAGEAGVPFFSLSGSDFVEMFVGVGAARVRDLFEQAQKRAPCIVFIDELDAIGKARGAGGPLSSNDEREQTLNQLLVEMDGFDARKGVIIMAATNRPEILDPALLRAGRFDRTISVGRPDIKGREQILRVHSKKVKLGPDAELKIIAQRTPGFSGSDLANIVNEAALLAARKGKDFVNLIDFDEAIERVVAGLSKKHGVLSAREKRIVSFHESGHTVVAATVPNADPVHKVSIIPRGVGALGYTLQMPLEDRYLMSRQELLDRITVLLGGRAAEALVFRDISTGASDDLTRATEIARRMVKEFGMSERLGQRTYGDARRSNMLGTEGGGSGWPGGEKEYSEETQIAIDEEVFRIIAQCYAEAQRILAERRDDLEVLASRLIEEEVVDRDTLDRILGIERDLEGRQVKPRRNGADESHDPIEKLKSGEVAQGEDDVDLSGAHH